MYMCVYCSILLQHLLHHQCYQLTNRHLHEKSGDPKEDLHNFSPNKISKTNSKTSRSRTMSRKIFAQQVASCIINYEFVK